MQKVHLYQYPLSNCICADVCVADTALTAVMVPVNPSTSTMPKDTGTLLADLHANNICEARISTHVETTALVATVILSDVKKFRINSSPARISCEVHQRQSRSILLQAILTKYNQHQILMIFGNPFPKYLAFLSYHRYAKCPH